MYLHDCNSVDDQWKAYLDELIGGGDARTAAPHARLDGAREEGGHSVKQAGVTQLIAAYRARGHLLAQIDPLGLLAHDAPPALVDFALETFGLAESDLDAVFSTDLPGFPTATLRDVVAILQNTYCRSIPARGSSATSRIRPIGAAGSRRRWSRR